MQNEKETSELLDVLNSINNELNLNNYIETIPNFNTSDLSKYFENLCIKKNIKKSHIINNSNINRTYGYQILNGTKKPSRDKIIQLCIGASLDLKETQKALTIGNVSELYAKSPRDSIIIFAINKKINIIETNELLFKFELSLLGEEDI